MALWPRLAGAAGLPLDGWRVRVLSAGVRRVVLRLSRGGVEVVLKHAPEDEGFGAGVEALRAAVARRADVPRVMAVDRDARAVVMDFVPGRTLFDALEAGERDVMARAGAALGAFHRCGLVERREFRPGFAVRYLREVLDDVAAGRKAVAESEAFRACARVAMAQAEGFRGRETVVAHLHGDMHLRNMILDGARGVVIDPRGGKPAAVGHDLARLIVDLCAMFPGGPPLARDDVGALLAAYRVVGPDDPALGMQVRARILAEWMAVPVAGRSANQARRWAGVRRLAEQVLT